MKNLNTSFTDFPLDFSYRPRHSLLSVVLTPLMSIFFSGSYKHTGLLLMSLSEEVRLQFAFDCLPFSKMCSPFLSTYPFCPYEFSLWKNLFIIISVELGEQMEIKTGFPSSIFFLQNLFRPFYRWDNWGTDRLNNLLKVSQQGTAEPGKEPRSPNSLVRFFPLLHTH